jgi:hypothetical protein
MKANYVTKEQAISATKSWFHCNKYYLKADSKNNIIRLSKMSDPFGMTWNYYNHHLKMVN